MFIRVLVFTVYDKGYKDGLSSFILVFNSGMNEAFLQIRNQKHVHHCFHCEHKDERYASMRI